MATTTPSMPLVGAAPTDESLPATGGGSLVASVAALVLVAALRRQGQ